MGLLNTLWPFDRNGTFTQHGFDDFGVHEEFERRFPLPGRWSELGDGFTAFPFIGALGTWHHYSMEGFPNLFTLGKVKTLGGIKAYIQFYLMEVLAPRCHYGGKAIDYWGNESINLTGIVGMTNNMINPLRLFQERGYIRDIWAAADYRKAIGELINGDWIDEDTLSVVARMQTFNPQTGCFIFTDIIFEVNDFGTLVLFVGAGASFFAHQDTVRNLIKAKGTFDNRNFVDLSPMADSEMLLRAFLSFALYCALVRSVSFMILRMEIRVRLTALKSTAPLIATLFVMLVHLMFAFLIIGSLLFGTSRSSDYYTEIVSPSSFYSFLEIIIGDATVLKLFLSELSTQGIGEQLSGILFYLALVIIFFFFGTAVIVAIEGTSRPDSPQAPAESAAEDIRRLQLGAAMNVEVFDEKLKSKLKSKLNLKSKS
ncbi:polycystic kidney disease and receptor for egg jelly-like protein [Chrysochromulina tobinii]|uniref:Polycystic kidney disease and receptor for egg jelly-like protein n=1 Tax=Chrysochromulina tobinii TaxID=1460289 RepID=A0A0M0JMU5_9EUKA|nr:polycystic kidney disease and receptor for egg jelly-like protein [Chrysochromulina tobinii]|eukprot:KOO27914.1 polycystic kidney disease and receptor for egg jelly-like protein [Chrysochromulina sp. CCMP291]